MGWRLESNHSEFPRLEASDVSVTTALSSSKGFYLNFASLGRGHSDQVGIEEFTNSNKQKPAFSLTLTSAA